MNHKSRFGLRVMPLVWLAFSIVYLLFAMSIEARRMPSDREGWDPGSNALPVALGYVMVGISAYLVVTDRRRAGAARAAAPAPDAVHAATTARASAESAVGKAAVFDEPTIARASGGSVVGEEAASHTPATGAPGARADVSVSTADLRALIALTVATTVAYIVAFRWAGFVVATTVLLMTLTYFYLRTAVRVSHLREYGTYLAVALVVNVALYSLGRWIIRWLQYFGRNYEIGLLNNRLITALIALAAWAVVAAPFYLVARRRARGTLRPRTFGARAMTAACATTLSLFLIFQQIFRVALPGGFIAW